MKKIFSALLSAALLMSSLLPVAVSADASTPASTPTAVTISDTETTTIDFTKYKADFKESDGTAVPVKNSGVAWGADEIGGYNDYLRVQTKGSGTTLTGPLTLTIPYSSNAKENTVVEFVAKDNAKGMELSIGGVSVLKLTGSSSVTNKNGNVRCTKINADTNKYTFIADIAESTGNGEIKLAFTANSDGSFNFALDSLTFKTTKEYETVTRSADTHIELVDFIYALKDKNGKFYPVGTNDWGDNTQAKTDSLGNRYFYIDSADNDTNYTEPATITFPMTIAEDGRYLINFGANLNGGAATITWGDTTLLAHDKADQSNLKNYDIGGKLYSNAVMLEAGTHDLVITLGQRASNLDVAVKMAYLDITTDLAASVDIAGGGAATTVNFADYAKSVYKVDDTTYKPVKDLSMDNTISWSREAVELSTTGSPFTKDGRYLFLIDDTSPKDTSMYVEIPVILQEDADYEMTFYGASLRGKLKVELDGNQLGLYENRKWGTETGNKRLNNAFDSILEVSLGTLKAGKHKLKFSVIDDASGSGLFCALDCFTIKQKSTYDYDTDGADVVANFGTATTGKVILALYANDELVGMAEKDVTDATQATFTDVKATVEPTEAKVFVWDGFENVTPVTTPIIFK